MYAFTLCHLDVYLQYTYLLVNLNWSSLSKEYTVLIAHSLNEIHSDANLRITRYNSPVDEIFYLVRPILGDGFENDIDIFAG